MGYWACFDGLFRPYSGRAGALSFVREFLVELDFSKSLSSVVTKNFLAQSRSRGGLMASGSLGFIEVRVHVVSQGPVHEQS